ncbi:MAG: helix-turn-helix domain-containing protein [Anaerolineae bacterium]
MSTYYTADRWVALLQHLARQGQDFLTLLALQRLTGLGEGAARKAVLRLEEKGYLTRVGRNLYANRFGHPTLERLAMILGAPCYISFESALERHGILSQVPLVLTCASTSRSERRQTPLGEILFHRLRPALFFGYRTEDGILWAEPEKALLDWLYIHRKHHGVTPPLDELNREPLDIERLWDWARHYPRPVRAALGAIGPGEGETMASSAPPKEAL